MNYNELSLFSCGAEGGRTVAMCVFRNSHKIKANRLCCNPLQCEILQIPSYKLQQIAPNCKQVDENCNYCQPILLHLFRNLEIISYAYNLEIVVVKD